MPAWSPSTTTKGRGDSPSALERWPIARVVRYQAAIMRDAHILLIQHLEHATGHAYWLLPGGGIEDGETDIECVRREAREETHLEVEVERLLLDEPNHAPGDAYERLKTYLCRLVSGEPRPGYEPEPEAAAEYSIAAVGWWSIDDETAWDAAIADDPITVSMLRQVRAALG